MKLNIVLASDDRGSNMLAIVAYSVIKNNSQNKLHFYIFHSDIAKENIVRIKRLEKQFDNVTITFTSIDKDAFEGVEVTNENVSMPAYYRYLAPKLLPQKEDRVLCLDFDMLCLGDIEELYTTNLGDNYLGAVADYVVENDPFYRNFKPGIGFSEADTYINSGLLLMNLESIRKTNVMDVFWKNVRNKNKLIPSEFNVFADQTVTNVTFRGKVKLLNARYNTFTTALEHTKWQDPLIIHYTGSYKPLTYRNDSTSIYDEVYYNYYIECMEIIGSDGGGFIKNTLKKLSQESIDNLEKLRLSEVLTEGRNRQLREANENIISLQKRILDLDAVLVEEHKSKNLLRNLFLNLDRNITNFLGENKRHDASRAGTLYKLPLSAYKILRRAGRRVAQAALK